MSLINDALKRATQAQPATNPTPATDQPMEPAPPHRAVGIPNYFTPVLLFVICGAFWFMFKGWDGARQGGVAEVLQPKAIVAQAREVAVEEPADMPPTTGAELPIPQNRNFALNDGPTPKQSVEPAAPIQVAQTTASSTGGALPVSAREVPAANRFRLQGIFYRPSSPSAVINSKTVFVGDTVADAKVKSIDQRSVVLDLGTQTQVLTLH